MVLFSSFRAIPLLLTILSLGCTSWHIEPTREDNGFRANSLAPDAVILEVAVLPSFEGQEVIEDQMWSLVDETALPLEERKILWNGGFRTGVASSQLPQLLLDLLERKRDDNELNTPDKIFSATETGGLKHLHCRSGIAQPITLSKNYESISWISDDNGYRKGESRENAQCHYSMRAYPSGDGGARVELMPEIQFGEAKSQFHATFNSWATKIGREKHLFSENKLAVELSLGQTLVVSCTPEKVGMGAYFFTDNDREESGQRILLIRLAQSQRDDLFAPDQILSPIVTPTD